MLKKGCRKRTVELLAQFLKVPIRDLQGSDVANDVHIRRVFLRTQLVERDDPLDIVTAARRAYPARPGALDLPAWMIGRQWCRPQAPACPACSLMAVCPKGIERAALMRGA